MQIRQFDIALAQLLHLAGRRAYGMLNKRPSLQFVERRPQFFLRVMTIGPYQRWARRSACRRLAESALLILGFHGHGISIAKVHEMPVTNERSRSKSK